MGIRRYELNEVQWARVAPLVPGKASDPGRTGSDTRLFVNGCLWILRSGAHRCDLPERYGRWKTVHRRFSRWCHAGVWERVFDTLTADRDNSYLMIDSTIVRAHQQAAAGKGGAKDQALGRSRGGLTTKSTCSRTRSAALCAFASHPAKPATSLSHRTFSKASGRRPFSPTKPMTAMTYAIASPQ